MHDGPEDREDHPPWQPGKQILAIGNTKRYSLCGMAGSRFWIDHWGYPAIGVYFGDCPSAGHDMFCLDY